MTKRIFMFILGILISPFLWFFLNFSYSKVEKFFYAQVSLPIQNQNILAKENFARNKELNIEAKAGFSLKIKKTGEQIIVFEKNSRDSLAVASLTKLMTAVVVLENEKYNPDSYLTISEKSSGQADSPNCGGLKTGEKFTMKNLLDLMLVCSSNDAAFALAEFANYDDFVAEMNEKTSQLRMSETRFINQTGLDEKNPENNMNRSSTRDLAKLSRYVLAQHPLIFEITLNKNKIYPAENGISDLIFSKNQILLGGKTGFTKKSGGSILTIFKDAEENIFINIILGAESEEKRVLEMQKLIDWLN